MKKIIMIMITLSILFFSGCSSVNIDDGVLRDESGDSILDGNAIITEDYMFAVTQGEIEGTFLINKFGASSLDNTVHPITISQVYQTPTTAQNLEFVSTSATDTYLGVGARQITIVGLNSSWQEVTQVINTSGTTPVQIPIPLTRLYRWYVSSSGSYASATVGSHTGILNIRGTGAGTLWSTIIITPFPIGQSQISAYTIPKGKTGYLLSKSIFTDTSKTADIYFFQRCGIDDITSPYNGTMRLVEREVGVTGGHFINFRGAKEKFVGPCDVGFMGKVTVGTAEISTEFELLVEDS